MTISQLIRESRSIEETEQIGRSLGAAIDQPLVIGLIGQLGAGKTALVRSIAEGLGTPDARKVSSPTFVLLQEYPGRLPIFHFDTYRLTSANQFAALGPEEYFESDAVCLVEWADRVEQFLPEDRLSITLTHTGEQSRNLHLLALGPRSEAVIQRWS